jgi:hypothetical protein
MSEDWKKELEERKKAYRASGMGIDFNKPVDYDTYAQDLADSMKRTELKKQYPTDLNIAYTDISFGADIEAEQAFQQELHVIVDDMKVKLVDEKKILEGTLNPEYGKGDWGIPHIERTITLQEIIHPPEKCLARDGGTYIDLDTNKEVKFPCSCGRHMENELSNFNPTVPQWKNDSLNGSLTTGPTHISTTESNNSACIAELFNRDCPIAQSDDKSTPSSTDSCSGRLDDCGTETDATNESSECTVPMISAAMLGMPSEVRWSPPRRSIVSSGQTLLGVKS